MSALPILPKTVRRTCARIQKSPLALLPYPVHRVEGKSLKVKFFYPRCLFFPRYREERLAWRREERSGKKRLHEEEQERLREEHLRLEKEEEAKRMQEILEKAMEQERTREADMEERRKQLQAEMEEARREQEKAEQQKEQQKEEARRLWEQERWKPEEEKAERWSPEEAAEQRHQENLELAAEGDVTGAELHAMLARETPEERRARQRAARMRREAAKAKMRGEHDQAALELAEQMAGAADQIEVRFGRGVCVLTVGSSCSWRRRSATTRFSRE